MLSTQSGPGAVTGLLPRSSRRLQEYTACSLIFSLGWLTMVRIRTGTFLFAPRLAAYGNIEDRFRSSCPFCGHEEAGDAVHLMLRCARWDGERQGLLRGPQPNPLPDIRTVGVLLGGDGIRLIRLKQRWWLLPPSFVRLSRSEQQCSAGSPSNFLREPKWKHVVAATDRDGFLSAVYTELITLFYKKNYCNRPDRERSEQRRMTQKRCWKNKRKFLQFPRGGLSSYISITQFQIVGCQGKKDGQKGH